MKKSSHIKIHQNFCLELFWTVFACKLCFICSYFIDRTVNVHVSYVQMKV